MNKKWGTAAAVLCLAAVACLTGCSGAAMSETDNKGDQRTEIVVGRVVPLTGSLAAFANGTPEVEKYAIDAVNDAGGIEIDGRKLPLKLVIADSESDPTKASEAAAKLIENHKVDIMITSHTDRTTVPVAAACEKAGVVCLSVDTPAEAWMRGGPYNYSYHVGFNTYNELSCFYDSWEQADTNRKVGIVTANDDAGIVMYEAITDFAAEKGYTVVDPGKFTFGSNDFTSLIKNLKENECEIIAGSMLTSDFSTFWGQCRENGYTPKVCTMAKATLFVEDVLAIGPNGEADGIVSEVWWTAAHPFCSSLTGETSGELAAWWCENMKADYAPATMGYKYANIEIIADVMKRAGTLDREKLLEAVKATELDTCVGHVSYNGDHVSVMPLVSGQWTWDGTKKTYIQNIVSNTQIPDVPVTSEMRIIEDR